MKYINNNKDVSIAVLLYTITLFRLLLFAAMNPEIKSDMILEYNLYLSIIENKGWVYIPGNLVNSCLLTTLLPSYVHRFTGIDPMVVFRVVPCLFYALSPPFVYLIARRYSSIRYALIAPVILLSSFYLAYYPAVGRVGVAWGLLAMLVWAVLSKRIIWAVIVSILMVFSHYATFYITGFIMCVACTYSIFRDKKSVRVLLTILSILLIGLIVWHMIIAGISANFASLFIKNTFANKPTRVIESTELPASYTPTTSSDIFDMRNREEGMIDAFGLDYSTMNTPQKIELVLSWLAVAMLTYGIYVGIRRRRAGGLHNVMAVSSYGLILLTMTIPYMSVTYGAIRVYFTSLIITAPYMVFGLQDISNKVKVNIWWVAVPIIMLYGLTVSGVTHLLWGIVK